MIRRLRKDRQQPAQIDLAALIDMVFILLIFFIVTTSFVRESGVAVDRPTSVRAAAVASGFVAVAITRDGSVHIAGRSIAPNDQQAIAAALHEGGSRRVVIQADRRATTGLLLEVMDSCLAAGADQVDVAAELP